MLDEDVEDDELPILHDIVATVKLAQHFARALLVLLGEDLDEDARSLCHRYLPCVVGVRLYEQRLQLITPV